MALSLTNPTTVFAVDLLIDVLVKGTIVLAATGLGAWLLRGSSAAMRHAVWSIALGTLLALLVLETTRPAWKLDALYVSIEAATGRFAEAGVSAVEAGKPPRVIVSAVALRPAIERGRWPGGEPVVSEMGRHALEELGA